MVPRVEATLQHSPPREFRLIDPATGQPLAVWSGAGRVWSGAGRVWSGSIPVRSLAQASQVEIVDDKIEYRVMLPLIRR